MARVVSGMSMSLDGFITGPNVSFEHPMGEGGMRLHDWMFSQEISDVDAEIGRQASEATGAVILGKRIFDVGIGPWGDVPYPVPCFVLTHEARDDLVMKSGAFTFVTDGIERALELARGAAGGKDVRLLGAIVTQQYLAVGLLDELEIQLVPVLLGEGTRLFEHLGGGLIELEATRVRASPAVTHLWFRPARSAESNGGKVG